MKSLFRGSSHVHNVQASGQECGATMMSTMVIYQFIIPWILVGTWQLV